MVKCEKCNQERTDVEDGVCSWCKQAPKDQQYRAYVKGHVWIRGAKTKEEAIELFEDGEVSVGDLEVDEWEIE